MTEDPGWFRLFHRFPGTDIVIYESTYPQPGIVLLSKHSIKTGATIARAEYDPDLKRSVNTKAGEEGSEFDDSKGYNLPAGPRRPKVEGLGADDADVYRRRPYVPKAEEQAPAAPRRRIVPPPTIQQPAPIVVQPEPVVARASYPKSKAPTEDPGTFKVPPPILPDDATPEQIANYKRASLRWWERKTKHEEMFASISVRGWRMRALSPAKEIEITGHSEGTQAKLAALFKRIPKDQKTWLQSAHIPYDDPYAWLVTNEKNALWTPWVKPECIAWLVVEGAKIGLYFAARAYPGSDPSLPNDARMLQFDVQKYLAGEVTCSPNPVRKKGLRESDEVLLLRPLESMSMSPGNLFQKYQEALRATGDKAEVHEAYHRVLLHRFLRRRLLVPTEKRSSVIGKEAERRANMLQAHRVFVFNRDGCPKRLNLNFLKANGIGLKELEAKNPTLVYSRNLQNQYLVTEWTNWLFTTVLGKDPKSCRSMFNAADNKSTKSIYSRYDEETLREEKDEDGLRGLYALAGMGLLG